MVLRPDAAISSRVIMSTGATVSESTRLMLEPVTSTFSTFCGVGVWANAMGVTINAASNACGNTFIFE